MLPISHTGIMACLTVTNGRRTGESGVTGPPRRRVFPITPRLRSGEDLPVAGGSCVRWDYTGSAACGGPPAGFCFPALNCCSGIAAAAGCGRWEWSSRSPGGCLSLDRPWTELCRHRSFGSVWQPASPLWHWESLRKPTPVSRCRANTRQSRSLPGSSRCPTGLRPWPLPRPVQKLINRGSSFRPPAG